MALAGTYNRAQEQSRVQKVRPPTEGPNINPSHDLGVEMTAPQPNNMMAVKPILDEAPQLQNTTSIEPTFEQVTSESEEQILVIPTDPSESIKFLRDQGEAILRKYSLKCKLNPDSTFKYKPGGLDQTQTRELITLLRAFANIKDLTKEMAKSINLENVLRTPSNQATTGVKFRFPQEVEDIAKEAFERYAREGWGANANNVILDENDGTIDEAEAGTARRPSKTPIPSTSTSTSNSRQQGQGVRTVQPPPRNHLIYGINGIMKGIVVVKGEKTTSYQFDTRPEMAALRKPCGVEGDNGLKVGAWWPMLMCANRDGAHGATMKGIAGAVDRGADSIVISGAYEGLDNDRGDVVFYSGSHSKENIDPDSPVVSKDTQAMRTAYRLGKSLRVIRGFKANWPGRPVCGYRYDGLYKIVGEKIEKNVRGGAYVRFELRREGGQREIDRSSPTARERELCGMVTNYY